MGHAVEAGGPAAGGFFIGQSTNREVDGPGAPPRRLACPHCLPDHLVQFEGCFALHHAQLGGGGVDPCTPPVGALQDEGGRCLAPAGLAVGGGQRVGAAGEVCDSVLLAGFLPCPAPVWRYGRGPVGVVAELGGTAGQFKKCVQSAVFDGVPGRWGREALVEPGSQREGAAWDRFCSPST